MTVVRLPVAGTDVLLRSPAGTEDILLLEAGELDARLALGLLASLARRVDGSPMDWSALAVTDLDVLLLRLRQKVLGDHVRADLVCSGPGCGTRVDVTFSIRDYLDHHRPRTPSGLAPAGEEGWFRLEAADVEFRLPSAGDQMAIALLPRPEQALLRLCLRPAEITGPVRRRVEKAMEAMAPSLCSELRGTCPDCGATVEVSFDPMGYTLCELRDQASVVYEEVAAIAQQYHWSEAEILALPTARRARYAELARRERATA